jgi:hypothetical protein
MIRSAGRSQGYAGAFSSVERGAVYPVGRGETSREYCLVRRPTYLDLIDDYQRLGLKGAWPDPKAGECGVKMDLDDLRAATV